MGDKRYYLGLDLGTNSIGWAVTDANYNLIRKKGKDCWGIREFERAEASADRRSHRTDRRRRQREQVRNGLIRTYFAEEIDKVDECFFARLDNSKYHAEDKDTATLGKYAIFSDKEYTDADYYRQYKSIYHLRKELVESVEPHDVRLVYLAVANIFKHRGHFLNAGIDAENMGTNIQLVYDDVCRMLMDISDEENDLVLPSMDVTNITDIIGDKSASKTAKYEKLVEMMGINKKDKLQKSKCEFLKCLCGSKVDIAKMFMFDTDKKIEFSFEEYDDKAASVNSEIGDENFQIIESLHQIYSYGLLSNIMKGHDYISQARVAEYDKHGEDLRRLKNVIRKHQDVLELKCPNVYDVMFRSAEPGSYGAYVNSYIEDNTHRQRRGMGGNSKRNREVFYKNIISLLSGIDDDEVRIA